MCDPALKLVLNQITDGSMSNDPSKYLSGIGGIHGSTETGECVVVISSANTRFAFVSLLFVPTLLVT